MLDGRLDNARSLAIRLRDHGAVIEEGSDAELVVRAINLWGDAALSRFEGPFALAFFHAAKQRILLAREVFGRRSLYTAFRDGSWAFASTVGALLSCPGVSHELDAAGVACFLAYGTTVDPLTLHRDVRAIPAGESGWWPLGGSAALPSTNGFHPQWFAAVRASTTWSGDVAAQAVRDEMRGSDAPVGLLLSPDRYGMGLTALARSVADGVTLTVGYDDATGRGQLDHLKDFGQKLGCGQARALVDDDWIVSHWRELHRCSDHPSSNALVLSISAGLARESDLDVVLTSLGYERVAEVATVQAMLDQATRWSRIGRLATAPGRNLIAATVTGDGDGGRRAAAAAAFGGKTLAESRAQMRRVLGWGALRRLGLAAEPLGLTPDYLPIQMRKSEDPGDSPILAALAGPSRDPMLAMTLRAAEDVGAANGVEFRMPWLMATALGGAMAFETGCCVAGSASLPADWTTIVTEVESMARRSAVKGLSTTDAAILPLREWFLGPLSLDCLAAMDELASCPLLDTWVVRQFWADFRSGMLDVGVAATLVSLGLYLERIRVQAG